MLDHMYEASGTIKLILDEQSFPSGFTKREFVVTTDQERYPQDLKFELVKEKCGLIEPFAAGQSVLVSFDIRGNEYNGRYFVNLSAWKIQPAGEGQTAKTPAATTTATTAAEPAPEDLRKDGEFDDEEIPF